MNRVLRPLKKASPWMDSKLGSMLGIYKWCLYSVLKPEALVPKNRTIIRVKLLQVKEVMTSLSIGRSKTSTTTSLQHVLHFILPSNPCFSTSLLFSRFTLFLLQNLNLGTTENYKRDGRQPLNTTPPKTLGGGGVSSYDVPSSAEVF